MTIQERKLPYPFSKIAVAVAFSPRMEAVLAEAKRLQDIFSAKMIFVHIGKKDLQQEQYLKEILHRFGLDKTSNEVVWEEGDTVEKILDVCSRKEVDLLVAGALEKESLLKYFLGSVARTLCRKAICSVLMLREPETQSKTIRHIVVEGSDHPKTVDTIKTALYVAKAMHAISVDVIQEEDPSRVAVIRSGEFRDDEADTNREKIVRHENEKLSELLQNAKCNDLKINVERIEGKPGFVITNYARDHQADLLVLNSPDTKLNFIDRVFPNDIEFALADLPCDLMIIHSQNAE